MVQLSEAAPNDVPLRIQRMVMTDLQWSEDSKAPGRRSLRSSELLAIDRALAKLNQKQRQAAPPVEQLRLLDKLNRRIIAWMHKPRERRSPRFDAVSRLNMLVGQERAALEASNIGGQAAGLADLRIQVKQVMTTAERATERTLATAVTADIDKKVANRNRIEDTFDPIRSRAREIRHQADGLADPNAALMAEALVLGVRELRSIALSHTGIQNGTRDLTARHDGLVNAMAGAAADEMTEMAASITAYRSFLAGPAAQPTDPPAQHVKAFLDWIDEHPAVEIILNEISGPTGDGFTLLGYQGTDGKGNTGASESYKSDAGQSQAREAVKTGFSRLVPSTAAGKDKLSGGADIAAAIAGLGPDALSFLQAFVNLRDPEDGFDKANALVEMGKTPASIVSGIMQITGGALTAHRSGGNLPTSSFGFTNPGGSDVSTDVKLAGDFAGAISGLLGVVQKVIGGIKRIVKRDAKSRAGARHQREQVGNVIADFTGATASLGSTYKSVTKLGYQIAGKGQITSQASGNVSTLWRGVPILGIVSTGLSIVRAGYRLIRLGIRRGHLTQSLAVRDERDERSLQAVEATEVVKETLVKRMARVGINLGHSLLGLAAQISNITGIGSAPGMAVQLASGAGQLGQVVVRKVKQAIRDRVANLRAAASDLTYGQWKQQTEKQAAAEGTAAQLKAWLLIRFKFNWDKSTTAKSEAASQAAFELLRLNDEQALTDLGVWHNLEASRRSGTSKAEQHTIVLKGLGKRS